MNSGKTVVFTIIMGVLIVAAILGAREWQAKRADSMFNTGSSGPQIRTTLPDFSFRDLEGRERKSNEWLGKVLVLNFWATWCPPCRKEMPLFVELQEELNSKGLQFVGIAIDDQADVKEFSDSLGVNYPVLIGENDAIQLSRDLGNRFSGLPFTVIFDRKGRINYAQAGELQRAVLDEKIKTLL